MEYKCYRCGHVWSSRLFGAEMGRIPKGSIEDKMWNLIITDLCKDTDSMKPCKCPHCYSPNWDVPTKTVHCFRCNHIWTARKGIPTKCSKCNNPLTARAFVNMPLRVYKKSEIYRKLFAINARIIAAKSA